MPASRSSTTPFQLSASLRSSSSMSLRCHGDDDDDHDDDDDVAAAAAAAVGRCCCCDDEIGRAHV